MQMNPYLIFRGDCAEAMAFYTELIGGSVEFMQTHGESPMAGQVPANWQDKVMHTRVRLGEQVLLGSDSPPDWYEKPQGFMVSLGIDNLDEARRVFDGLAEGGTVKMTFEPTFWAKGFGMLTDRFGIPWMVNCENPA